MLPRSPGEPPPDLSKPLSEVRVLVRPELAGLRLDQALAKLLPWRTRSSIQRLIKDGFVRVAPKGAEPSSLPARAGRRLHAGDLIVVEVPPRALAAPAPAQALPEPPVLFEDRWLVAFDKPAGLAVHPAGRRLDGTLINYLHARYRDLEHPERDVVPRLCHRLDRETSGVILVAKDPRAHSKVRKEFEAGRVAKTYLALVEGCPPPGPFLIDAPIGPALRSKVRLKMAVRPDGLESLTEVERLECAGSVSLVRCRPRTGRQHQIRVHLAHIGHPLVGDKLYGPDESWFLAALRGPLPPAAQARLRLPRHALHSHRLELRHPMTGDMLMLEAPLPADLQSCLAEARAGAVRAAAALRGGREA